MAEKNQWYKHYPLDFYHGTEDLSIEEIGAYQLMLNLIYARQGPVADNDKFIAGHMRVSSRKWRAFRKRLLETGKLFLEDGKLMNVRAQTELENSAKAARRQREHGAKGARTRDENRARANKNKDLNQGSHKQPDKETEENKKVIPPSGTPYGERDAKGEPDLFQPDPPEPEPAPPPETKPKAKRGKPKTKIPGGENWTVEQPHIDYARSKGMTDDEIYREAEKFRDHHVARATLFADWLAGWRTWVQKYPSMGARAGARRAGPPSGYLSADDAAREVYIRCQEREGPDAGRAFATRPSAEPGPHDRFLQSILGPETGGREEIIPPMPPGRSSRDAGDPFQVHHRSERGFEELATKD